MRTARPVPFLRTNGPIFTGFQYRRSTSGTAFLGEKIYSNGAYGTSSLSTNKSDTTSYDKIDKN